MVIQWSRSPIAGSVGSTPGQGTKIHVALHVRYMSIESTDTIAKCCVEG